MTALRRLWRGELPLAEAFWTWAVVVGLLVNGATTAGFLVLLLAERPIEAFIVGYVFSVPYNVIAAVGVWRSAERHAGDRNWANAARVIAVVGLTLLSFT
jgi:hypothetical protein